MGVFWLILFSVCTLGAALGAFCWLYPRPILYMVLRYAHYFVGLKRKFMRTETSTFCYYEREAKGPTLIFLHGFSSNKSLWIGILKYLPKHWRVVIPDLPGHGESSYKFKDDYSAKSCAQKINMFVEGVGLEEFHLIGLSMGALLSATYATLYPMKVNSLTLMCMPCLEPLSGNITNLWKQMKEEGPSSSVLLPEDSTALSNLFKTAIYNSGKFQLPRRVLEAYLELQLPHYPALRDIRRQAMMECDIEELAQEMAAKIVMPTLIIWGDKDKICHPAGAEVLNNMIKSSKLIMINNCGHIISIERPRKCVKEIVDFILVH